MPWHLSQRDGQWCVVKDGESSPVPGGCHDSRADAIKHQKALYANERNMTASAFPLRPPGEWFVTPEAAGPQPLTVEASGQVSGHLALWGQCHTGFNECVSPPRGDSFDGFHVGALETTDGTIPVGKLMVGGKHAPLAMSMQAASQHYDDTSHVGAYVRASEGEHGIWLAGAVRSDISPELLRDLRANPPSGDWRGRGGRLNLIAALAVPIPGFPVTRALAASGALLLAYTDEDDEPEERSKQYIRQRETILASLDQ